MDIPITTTARTVRRWSHFTEMHVPVHEILDFESCRALILSIALREEARAIAEGDNLAALTVEALLPPAPGMVPDEVDLDGTEWVREVIHNWTYPEAMYN